MSLTLGSLQPYIPQYLEWNVSPHGLKKRGWKPY